VVIIDFRACILSLVKWAIQRQCYEVNLSHLHNNIISADKVELIFVVKKASLMQELKVSHFVKIIPNLNRPGSGVCIGKQLVGLFRKK